MIEKEKLRNNLFEKYFEVESGIPFKDLMNSISPITEIWQQLHKLLEQNLEYYNKYNHPNEVKLLTHNNNNYLIIKLHIYQYVIINLNTKQTLTQNEVLEEFDEQFFIDNFKERKLNNYNEFTNIYFFQQYLGNTEELINFYFKHIMPLSIPNSIYYKLSIDNAWTTININITNGEIHLAFRTKDQLLYENLFINPDLTPFGLQDAVSKIGLEKITEMFSRIKDIIIPINCIPIEFFNQNILSTNNTKENISHKIKKKDK